MKSKIISPVPAELSINWDKIQLVRSKLTGDIYLTSGKHNIHNFSGTRILNNRGSSFGLGEYSDHYDKKQVTLVESPITIQFEF